MKTDSSSSSSSRKQRRMQSNRESARRSRMKKQKHLDDLAAEVALLSKQNSHISNSINAAADQCLKIEARNSVLRAQITELSQRLHSLAQILTNKNNCWGTHHHPIMGMGMAAAQTHLFHYCYSGN